MNPILLIHHEDVVMTALGAVLQQEGYPVDSAASLEAMAGSEARLVLVDSHGQSLDAQGSLADLKLQHGVQAAVYLFASDPDDELLKRAEFLGADGFVSTEWGFRRLVSVVRRAANRELGTTAPLSSQDMAFNSLNRILVLDDHGGARSALVDELATQGYAAKGTGDLEDFKALIISFDPDLVLADVVMPGVNGDEVCKRLKSEMGARKIPIILISSLPEYKLKARASRAGADAYFMKQDGLPVLIKKIEELLSEIVF